jgi:glycine dehydrogenase
MMDVETTRPETAPRTRQQQGLKRESVNLEKNKMFSERHIGPSSADQQKMLQALGFKTLDELTRAAVPSTIYVDKPMDLGPALSESGVLEKARTMASKNQVLRSYIGLGYYGTLTPTVILRNIMENPGWYTAYTPYQAEISQGRMEALLNFQTMVTDLTGMEISNSSLLDEGTAAAEAMTLSHHVSTKKNALSFFVAHDVHPQTVEVLQTRATPLGIKLVVGDPAKIEWSDDFFGAIVQFPSTDGNLVNYREFIEKAHQAKVLVTVATDLLALVTCEPPGRWGADVVVGSSQRFGVPMGFGGPHAAFLATKEDYKRSLPGRLIGVSVDSRGKPALRLALQTREQHIRREKATSNICTAQVLLAVMASMYAVYHGPEGLKAIAKNVHTATAWLSEFLKSQNVKVVNASFFDTLKIQVANAADVLARGVKAGINLRRFDNQHVGVSLDETVTAADLVDLAKLFVPNAMLTTQHVEAAWAQQTVKIPSELTRSVGVLQHPIFSMYHSETEMLRYIFRLQSKDITLAQSMIPLGSCTMKLNATTEMIPVTWPEFSKIHPFAPLDQVQGYLDLISELESQLCSITGFAGVSLQPNAGSQGEYAGLLVIRKYFESRGEQHRNVCLIPSSAHGTNPASAVMAGMKVVVTACDSDGNVDLADLKAKIAQHKDILAALMVTYPSTHGVFEASIKEICELIHAAGGQVYMDGANLNALVGVARPADIGVDVSHMNLHKTFCIPHGGGGPGVGPIGVRGHLKPFLPTHSMVPQAGPSTGVSATTSSPWGSASILPISWAYISMMGAEGLRKATQVAILNANYIAHRLNSYFPVLYRGQGGLVAHECIIDLRQLKVSANIDADDVAKRLMDYGFHAPTMSWPVAGTLMIEPTESESLKEMERFCQAMISIRQEIAEVEKGTADKENNVLKNAPHPVDVLMAESWNRPYSREKAAFPAPWLREQKYFTPVGRVNNAHGDRNLVCACPPLEDYQ